MLFFFQKNRPNPRTDHSCAVVLVPWWVFVEVDCQQVFPQGLVDLSQTLHYGPWNSHRSRFHFPSFYGQWYTVIIKTSNRVNSTDFWGAWCNHNVTRLQLNIKWLPYKNIDIAVGYPTTDLYPKEEIVPTMGSIMAVVAVLLMNIESIQVHKLAPNISNASPRPTST